MGEAKRRLAAVKLTRISLVRDMGRDAETDTAFRLGVRELARRALKEHGPSAFDCTRKAAAIHEAGHCIVNRARGDTVTECCIEARQNEGKEFWLGKTVVGGGAWWASADSNPHDDLDIAASTFAGVAAEMLFDENYKLGSSLDELVIFQMLCGNAANKLGLDRMRLVAFMHANVVVILKHNRAAHAELTRRLLEQENLDEAEIGELLAPVVPMGRRVWQTALPPPKHQAKRAAAVGGIGEVGDPALPPTHTTL